MYENSSDKTSASELLQAFYYQCNLFINYRPVQIFYFFLVLPQKTASVRFPPFLPKLSNTGVNCLQTVFMISLISVALAATPFHVWLQLLQSVLYIFLLSLAKVWPALPFQNLLAVSIFFLMIVNFVFHLESVFSSKSPLPWLVILAGECAVCQFCGVNPHRCDPSLMLFTLHHISLTSCASVRPEVCFVVSLLISSFTHWLFGRVFLSTQPGAYRFPLLISSCILFCSKYALGMISVFSDWLKLAP